jgi:VanZ family protein
MKYRFPAFFWALVIFVVSSIPSTKLPNIALLHYDKLIHAMIFFILGLLVYRALEPPAREITFNWQRAFIVVLCVIIYGASDEFHQGFVPGRSKDLWDLIADAIGGVCSVLFMYLMSKRKGARTETPA